MSSDVDVFVGRRVRRRRRLLGMTQQELAEACGVCFQQVQKYECAYTRLSVAMLWKLAGALQVDIAYFFAGLAEQTAQSPGRSAYDAAAAGARRARNATPAAPKPTLLKSRPSASRATQAKALRPPTAPS